MLVWAVKLPPSCEWPARHAIAQADRVVGKVPAWVLGPEPRCGTAIGIKVQQHEGWRSPCRPIFRYGRGPDETPQPAHRPGGAGTSIITRPGDDGNGDAARNSAPIAPPVELGEIVGPHHPD